MSPKFSHSLTSIVSVHCMLLVPVFSRRARIVNRLTEDVQYAVVVLATTNVALLQIAFPLLVLVTHLERHQPQCSVTWVQANTSCH